MNILKYKDYQGSVTFEDGRLLIQVLHVDDFLTTEVDKASEAQTAFEELVNDYLTTCAELGKEPNKPFKGTFQVRLPPQLHRQAAMAATEKGESLNQWVISAIERSLERGKGGMNVIDITYAQEFIRAATKHVSSVLFWENRRPAKLHGRLDPSDFFSTTGPVVEKYISWSRER